MRRRRLRSQIGGMYEKDSLARVPRNFKLHHQSLHKATLMTVLTTRALQFRDENGIDALVTLTIFEPIKDENDGWRCIFDFEPPINPRNAVGRGVDWIQAFTVALRFARLYFETTKWSSTGHWQGMRHLGLPDSAAQLPMHESSEIAQLEKRSRALDVLATRRIELPSENVGSREITLIICSPFLTEAGSWKCAFTLDPIDGDLIRHGMGADFIEAFLDALAAARRVVESMIPAGWTGADDLFDCADFPIKSGRAFHIGSSQH